VRFYALGERVGRDLTRSSRGRTWLLQDLDGWKITAFELRRGDKETDPPPSPSPSASASASGSSG
jgi:hypothetical protein